VGNERKVGGGAVVTVASARGQGEQRVCFFTRVGDEQTGGRAGEVDLVWFG
jgi:sugar/nucleoside kinase (ribokinase family)